ncbi:rust resistance kinase Lr10-like [Vitis riparia]|uniref:rust resistance kinase Lr10-like n=1 Tax=Vitis riparia TaxID=96939 RepID=UPI00155A4A98|nr:rust resistance kinase Lr10-like [Vitis riparia]
MGISLFFFFLFMRLFAEINGGSQDDECKASRCSHHGPVIRFPFRLKHQPEHCGYPEFELSCSEEKWTILELPSLGKFWVKEINYTSQEIFVQYPDDCLRRQFLNLNLSAFTYDYLSASPFTYDTYDFTFFNCSENKTYELWSNPCSFLPVYVAPSSYSLAEVNLSSCRQIFNATLPYYYIYGREWESSMNWSKPMCGNCEAKGNKCQRKKNNSTEPEIECIDKPAKGAPMDKMVLTEAILGFLHFTFGIFIIFIVYRSNKLKREHRINIQKFLEDYRALKPSRYSYADIKKITNNFKDKLGQGGYGTVYKGKLSNEVFVAVKILDDFKGNGEDFINEVGTMSTIHHVNVVRLLGFCADGYKQALIYEFLPNESLDKFIFSAFGNNYSLGWHKLQDIAIGIAKGIEYLHQGCDQRILHLDIKPHNILLDHNFNPKISDFGLAKLCSKEQSAISMTAARGTMGYIAPEMLSRNFGNVSSKSDVYSFGMLLIEMVGGRKNIDATVENTSQAYFPEWLYNHLDQEQEVHIRIEDESDIKIAKKLSIIGLWCIQWYPIDRPSMKIVVGMLEGEEGNLVMPPNPFTSMGQTRTSVRRRKTSIQPELTVISEIE